jgi:uncharacterized membrane protein HdeD (DUF308 family)
MGKSFPKFLLPRFDETSMFLISLSFFLVIIFDNEVNSALYKVFFSGFNPAFLSLYMVFFLFLAGAIYSFLHVFTKRRKTEFEKFSMVYFTAFANGASGIFAGLVMFKDSPGILMIFPIWNMINGFIIILAYKLILYDEDGDLDTNSNPLEIVIGSIVVFVTFAICHFVFPCTGLFVFQYA